MPRLSPLALRGGCTLLLGLAACGGQSPPPDPAPVAVPDTQPLPAPAPAVVRVDTVTVRDPELETRLARLELRLAEREAQVEALTARLDDAHGEVAQALAKLQNGATRAEAASALAEAEIAVQGMPAAGTAELGDDQGQARNLLAQSNAAFGAGNYGGARYLATKSKTLAARVRARVSTLDRGGRRSGEKLFAEPVRFLVASRANLREGPGLGTRVLSSLERGERVTATSYLGEWLRVKDSAGREGWIFQPLVTRD
ncbi:MAG: SH3 domain-containing protein [Gemmatimonadetes bacterium]|nr:SH3 domain-containing protein [Gemmatimonadota bacterium]MBK7717022.1 SH3 domain-containing protein [Gemmatimonadota bacterium]